MSRIRLPKFLVVLISLFVFGLLSVETFAQIIDQTKDSLKFPKSIEEQKEAFSLPDSVYIVPFKLEFDEYVTTNDWYKGIYYYQTFRLNQGDFLFHYFVTKDGKVLEGNSKGEEQRFALKDTQEKPVIIGYLAENDSDDFSTEGREALNSLIVEVANRNRIKLENIFVKSFYYQATEQQQIVGVPDIVAGRWERSLTEMTKEIAAMYDPAKFKFELSITSVKTPTEKVKYGDQVVAEITIKNNSSISLYESSDFEPIMTKVGSDDFSKFFVNGVWSGPKQTKIMAEGTSIRPGESKTFQVRVGVPLYFDKQTEKFQLVNVLGEVYAGSEFDITLDVNKSDMDVVEIANTPVGYLNVREQANTSSRVVTKVSPGQRFVVMERSGSSWVKIDAGANGQGWISTQYAKKV